METQYNPNTVRSQLTDLGEWLGTDAVSYLAIVALFEDFEKEEGLTEAQKIGARQVLESLDLIHRIMKRRLTNV